MLLCYFITYIILGRAEKKWPSSTSYIDKSTNYHQIDNRSITIYIAHGHPEYIDHP